jgi:hypothetical protein
MFKHVYQPERTPEGQQQRKPSEHPDLMKFINISWFRVIITPSSGTSTGLPGNFGRKRHPSK